MKNTLENVQYERKNLREWGIWNAYTQKFYDMDFIPFNEAELITFIKKRLSVETKKLTENQTQITQPKAKTLLIDELPLGYTFVECERYLAHIGNDKKFCSIVNLKEPLYLLNFQIKLVNHSAQPIINEHNKQLQEQNIARQKAEENRLKLEKIQKDKKDNFKSDLKKWGEKGVALMVNGISTEQKEVYYSSKPKASDYGLNRENFDSSELQKLATDYNIHF